MEPKFKNTIDSCSAPMKKLCKMKAKSIKKQVSLPAIDLRIKNMKVISKPHSKSSDIRIAQQPKTILTQSKSKATEDSYIRIKVRTLSTLDNKNEKINNQL
jgi:hypothetical protein